MSPRILAFDTSATVTSVAVCSGSSVIVEHEHADNDRHAEILLPRVQACLAQAGLALSDIDLLGVGIGPGSFTGVRVGVATAKGLGLGLQLPVCGVVSLEALALGAAERGEWLAPCLDAFKGELFGALYRMTEALGLQLVLPPFHAAPIAALERIAAAAPGCALTLFGNGLRRYAAEVTLPAAARLLEEQFDVPRARHIARLALAAHERGEVSDVATLTPLYLRGSDAQLPKTPLQL